MDLTRTPQEIDADLEAFRRVGDPLGDAVVAELIRAKALRGPGGDLVGALESQARAGGRASAELLEYSYTVPSWVRFPDMKVGAQLGLRTVVQSALSLILGSLLETYGSARGAKVLIRGGMLTNHVLQRLRDTMTFVLEIAASRGPMPGTTAHRHILRTRLVHAFIRHGVLKRGDWNADAWGHPINQEDYASTLLAFCHVYLRSMARLGATPTAEEEASVHHLYRWVGYVMGITPGAAHRRPRRGAGAVRAHHAGASCTPTTTAGCWRRASSPRSRGRRPMFLPASALAALARQMLGDEYATDWG